MRILLTNDDGIDADGIVALHEALSADHDVYLIAPDREKSASSNAITIHSRLTVTVVDSHRIAVHGYPADCVNIGIHGKLIPEIDMVVSGVNHGANLGDDIYYSGTVGAARAGYIFNKHAVAVSLDSWDSREFLKDAAVFAKNFINRADIFNNEKKRFININYPPIPEGEIAGVKYTTLGRRRYVDSYQIMERNGNDISMKFDGYVESDHLEGSDVTEIKKGYISITPLTLDSTDYSWLDILRKDS